MRNDRIEEDQREAKHREAVALFRYGRIADLCDVSRRGLYKKLREKAARDYEIPGSTRRRVAPETLRGWLRDYRRGGFGALLPKPRSDNGLTRAIPREVADLLLETKDRNRALTVPLLIDKVRETGRVPAELVLAPATVHRLLAQHGLNKLGPPEASSKDRRHFAYEKAGELWMSDVMHGPSVPVTDRKKKTYLIALIDDATRIVPYASFALLENTAGFLPVFEQAILRRGIPRRLYVDNGAAYRSHHLNPLLEHRPKRTSSARATRRSISTLSSGMADTKTLPKLLDGNLPLASASEPARRPLPRVCTASSRLAVFPLARPRLASARTQRATPPSCPRPAGSFSVQPPPRLGARVPGGMPAGLAPFLRPGHRLASMGSTSDAPTHHARLVRELAELPESERRAVIKAAGEAASGAGGRVTVSWPSIRAAVGVVVTGEPADAIEDSARLYDG